MLSANAIVVRVFSGPHIGAELQLPVGDHVIGSEDSCDIIFVDSSLLGRHAVVHVRAQDIAPDSTEGTPTQGGEESDGQKIAISSSFVLSLTPLDGQVFVAGELVAAQGMTVPACTLFEIGTTSLAWNIVGLPWSDMSVASMLMLGDKGRQDGLTEASTEGLGVGGDAGLSFYDDLGVGLDDTSSESLGESDHAAGDGIAESDEVKSVSLREKITSLPIKTLLSMFLAILCLCGIMVSFEGRAPDMAAHASELEMQLHAMGMTGLSVSNTDDGILVQGVLDSHAQRNDLWRVTTGLLYPVQIDATVREDLLLAVGAAFNSRHIYPEVLCTTAHNADSADIAVQISGYFQDGQVEAWAFQAMHEDVPSAFRVERNVRHQEDVNAVLEPALLAAQLEHVRTRYMPGVVQVAGHFDLEQHAALDKVLIAVQDELGVPIRFEVYAELPKSIQVAAANNTSDPRALKDAHKEAKKEGKLSDAGDPLEAASPNPMGDLSVVSVTLKPLCFFATNDGQRFFEGALLPSGYSVEKITMDALTLKKDGTEIVHNLRGNHE